MGTSVCYWPKSVHFSSPVLPGECPVDKGTFPEADFRGQRPLSVTMGKTKKKMTALDEGCSDVSLGFNTASAHQAVPRVNPASSKGKGQFGNSREREKTQSVNIAFTALRTLIPTEPIDRKLSKIETLRLASSYISHLSSQLNSSDQRCCPDESSSASQHKICTFCLSEFKKSKLPKVESSTIPTPINYQEDAIYPMLDIEANSVPIITNSIFY